MTSPFGLEHLEIPTVLLRKGRSAFGQNRSFARGSLSTTKRTFAIRLTCRNFPETPHSGKFHLT